MDLNAIDLMLATNHPPFSRAGWMFEFKYDGYRVLASKDQLVTRNKKDATTWYPEIVQALSKVRGSFIIDSEVRLLDSDGIPNFEEMRGRALRKRGELVTYFAFEAYAKRAMPFSSRMKVGGNFAFSDLGVFQQNRPIADVATTLAELDSLFWQEL